MRSVRVMFFLYLTLIALGLGYAIALGLLEH
jgi:hypothetical protein